MKDVLEKLKQNKDIDSIKHLMANYDNSTLEEKLTILEDLDYYMHQIDNGGFHLHFFYFISSYFTFRSVTKVCFYLYF